MRDRSSHRRGVPGRGRAAPPWWPEGETWPPRRGPEAGDWRTGGRRLFLRFLTGLSLLVVVPLVVGVVLAVTLGGWTSLAVAALFWSGIIVVAAGVVRFGFRTWRPVSDLIDTAGRLADGDYEARVSTPAPAPLVPMIGSFNRMAERMERTEIERRRLLADIGHELRTPLTIVRGELEAIADGVHPPDGERLTELLGDVGVMERLLDDLQTLSTAEAGRLRIHREPTDLVDLVEAVAANLTGEARSVGVSLEVRAPAGAARRDPALAEAEVDPVRLREVVTNLVTNAIRASAEGGRIEIRVAADDEGGWATIEVADDGRGIPDHEIEHVFDRFRKGAGSSGSGLGLTISRNLVEAHRGRIGLTSEVGVGTTVTVELPIGPDPMA